MTEETVGGQETGSKAEVKNIIAQFEAMLDEYMVKKAPFALPLGLREFLATIAPYLIIISVILALPFILAALGLSVVSTPFAMMGGYGYGWGAGMMIAFSTTAIVLVLEVMAVPGLFKRTMASWKLMFYASLVNLVGGILALNVVGAIIGAVIGWYIIFQMKELYKN